MAKCPNAGNWIKCRAEILRGDGECKMPNHDEHCNIIPKRKPRMARVKAWAWMDSEKEFIACRGIKYGNKDKEFNLPCFILIDRKYLEAKK